VRDINAMELIQRKPACFIASARLLVTQALWAASAGGQAGVVHQSRFY
jgi:hypothetical protein